MTADKRLDARNPNTARPDSELPSLREFYWTRNKLPYWRIVAPLTLLLLVFTAAICELPEPLSLICMLLMQIIRHERGRHPHAARRASARQVQFIYVFETLMATRHHALALGANQPVKTVAVYPILVTFVLVTTRRACWVERHERDAVHL